MSHRPLNSRKVVCRYSSDGRAALEEGYGVLVGELVIVNAEPHEIQDIAQDLAEERFA